jgi:hypothetical protein
MLTKKIWIVSKYPWVATLRSVSGSADWFSLSKSSGEANYPAGEAIDVVINDISYNKNGYVDVLSNSTTISVSVKLESTNTCTWAGYVNVLKKACFNAFSHDYSRAFNCTSPEAP